MSLTSYRAAPPRGVSAIAPAGLGGGVRCRAERPVLEVSDRGEGMGSA